MESQELLAKTFILFCSCMETWLSAIAVQILAAVWKPAAVNKFAINCPGSRNHSCHRLEGGCHSVFWKASKNTRVKIRSSTKATTAVHFEFAFELDFILDDLDVSSESLLSSCYVAKTGCV